MAAVSETIASMWLGVLVCGLISGGTVHKISIKHAE